MADRSTTVITKQTVVYPSAGATSLSQSVPHRKPTNEIPKIDSKGTHVSCTQPLIHSYHTPSVTIEDLLAMFPAKLDPFEMPFYKQEMARFTSYNTELRKNFDRLSSQHGQDIIDIPAVEDLRVFLQQRDELAADLEVRISRCIQQCCQMLVLSRHYLNFSTIVTLGSSLLTIATEIRCRTLGNHNQAL